jgi:predicted MFS family arabinose efflux permease
VSLLTSHSIGGALAEKITWRWSFYGVVFIGAFALSLMAFISMNEPNRKFLWHVLRNIRPSDFVLLFSRQVGLVGSLVCLCLTLYLGESSDWRYPAFIPLIIVAVALIIGICFLEWIFRLDPYSPFRKFDRRTWSLVALSAMWGASLSVWNQFLRKSNYLQRSLSFIF